MPKLDDWTRMFKPNWESIALESGLGKTELRVLILVSARVGMDNRIGQSQREMAEELRVTPSAVSRAMRRLIDGGLILQQGHRYWVNSRLVAEQKEQKVVNIREREKYQLREREAHWHEERQERRAAPWLEGADETHEEQEHP